MFSFFPMVPRAWKYWPPPRSELILPRKSWPDAGNIEVALRQIQPAEDIIRGTESHEKTDISCRGFFDFDIDIAVIIAEAGVIRCTDGIDIDGFKIADRFESLLGGFQFTGIEGLARERAAIRVKSHCFSSNDCRKYEPFRSCIAALHRC